MKAVGEDQRSPEKGDIALVAQRQGRLDYAVLEPLAQTSGSYWIVVGLLCVVVAWGLYAYVTQLHTGLVVTALRDKILWGLYITNFVFFIGISHAGTLLSAILRVTKAGWRVPVTRMAEFITVVALMVGALFPLIDMGRPERILNMVFYGRWQSPLVWDLLAIATYLTGSLIYLYLPLIPDLALCRDTIGARVTPLKRWFYAAFALGWRGTPGQQARLLRAIATMMVIIIPVAVSVHTVISWLFAMTLRAGWNSTVFGAYFVAGAIFSGIAAIIIVMAILRRVYHLEEFITLTQFRNLGYMLGAFTLIMAYFNLSEYLTIGYKLPEGEDVLLASLFAGSFGPYLWAYFVGGLLLPALLVFLPWTRSIPGIVLAAVLVAGAMWIERYVIIVATLSVPLMPYAPDMYLPSWVEWSIVAAAFAGFALIIALFSRLFPIVSVWEIKEGWEKVHAAPAPGTDGAAARLAPVALQTGGGGHD